jgi:drug/metabolite transporter (DMT)-like permease
LYARLILKEKFSALETAGAALAIAGLLILRLAG